MNRLKEIRESKGLSVSKLAEESGVTRQTIHSLEREDNHSARTSTLKCLAEALDVKVSDFFVE